MLRFVEISNFGIVLGCYQNVHFLRCWVFHNTVCRGDELGQESFHLRQCVALHQQSLEAVLKVRLLTGLGKQTFYHLVPARLVHVAFLFKINSSLMDPVIICFLSFLCFRSEETQFFIKTVSLPSNFQSAKT